MRKLATILAKILVVGAVVSGCGQNAATPTTVPVPAQGTTKTAVIKKVGLITDGGKVDDKGFNELAWNGVQKAAKEFNLQSSYVESQQPSDFERDFARMGDEGYDFIVAAGFLIADATKAAAAKYPKVNFAIVDYAYEPSLPNAIGLIFAEDEGGFLAGALAAQLTKSNVIGGVYGKEIPPVIRFRKGYEAGAAFVNPKVKVLGVYIDSFTDEAKGSEVARSLMAENAADVVFGAGGITGNGALVAARQKGVYGIGVDTDQYLTLPEARETLVSSAVKRVAVAVYSAIKLAAQDTFRGGTQLFSAANDGIGLAPFHDFESKVPEAVRAGLDKIQSGLKDGSIRTNVKP